MLDREIVPPRRGSRSNSEPTFVCRFREAYGDCMSRSGEVLRLGEREKVTGTDEENKDYNEWLVEARYLV